MGLSDLKKAELIALCEENDLDTSGVKADLVARLEPVLSWDDAEAEEEVEAPVEAEVEETPSSDVSGGKTEDLLAIPDDEAFVKQAYLDLLGREADPEGLKHYTNRLMFHRNMTRGDLIQLFKNTTE
tara:strand:+ start:91 stop:471 length:381 start_codon:yes stop_codon:yes gene_type:complete